MKIILPVCLALTLSLTTHAYEGDSHTEEQQTSGRVLGHIDFPTTTQSEAAQAAFIQGMLLMHVFEYPFAQLHFQTARELDPGFILEQ